MIDIQSVIITDLFSREPNEFLTLIQPIRNLTVADQLISTRHMWSDGFNVISTDYSELENILVGITEQVGVLNNRFASKPSEERQPYALRQFKVAEFLQFLQAGKNVFRDTIQKVEDYYTQQQAQKDYYSFPLDPKFKPPSKSLIKEFPTLFVHRALINTFGDTFNTNESLAIEKMIENGKFFEPPKIITVGGAIFSSENTDIVDACIGLEISTIPVLFVDNYAKSIDNAKINSKNEFVVDCVVDEKKLVENSTSEEFVEFSYHQWYVGKLKNIYWTKSNFSQEKQDFEKIAQENKIPIKQLEQLYTASKPEKLTNEMWKQLERSQSFSIKQLEDVEKITKDYRKLILEASDSRKMYMPIVLEKNSKYILIAGELRLMICKAMKIQPQVVVLKM
jgi:hypothetical protein